MTFTQFMTFLQYCNSSLAYSVYDFSAKTFSQDKKKKTNIQIFVLVLSRALGIVPYYYLFYYKTKFVL